MHNDLREELKARIEKAQEDLKNLLEKRGKYDEQIAQIQARLKIWGDAFALEREDKGDPNLPLFSKEPQPYRFTGMKLIEAVDSIRKEQPGINKKMAREILEKNSFDFQGKRPGTAIHFVWIALDKRAKKAST